MNSEFAGQAAVVTGGARGIGLAIVKELLARGCRVSVWDRAFEGFEIQAVDRQRVDVADAADVQEAFARTLTAFGRLDILINNAGINGPIHRIEDYPPDRWDEVIRVDLTSVFNCCRVAIPEMRRANYGRIVNIASIAGKEGSAGASPYSAAKAGVIGFSKAVAKELAETGVTINCVAPAIAETDLFKQMTEAHIANARSKIPMNRFAKVEEIAAVALFAASPACSFTSGFTFDATGGRATY